MTELQMFGSCSTSKVLHQLSHADAPSLLKQLSAHQVNENIELVNQFMAETSTGGNLEKARDLIHEDFEHRSPTNPNGGLLKGKENFIKHLGKVLSQTSFEERRLGTFGSEFEVVIRYDSVSGGRPGPRMQEFFKIQGQKIKSVENYLLSFPK